VPGVTGTRRGPASRRLAAGAIALALLAGAGAAAAFALTREGDRETAVKDLAARLAFAYSHDREGAIDGLRAGIAERDCAAIVGLPVLGTPSDQVAAIRDIFERAMHDEHAVATEFRQHHPKPGTTSIAMVGVVCDATPDHLVDLVEGLRARSTDAAWLMPPQAVSGTIVAPS
jgi:hypothetical protein